MGMAVFLFTAGSLAAFPADVTAINDRKYLSEVLRCIDEAQSRVSVIMFSAIRYDPKRYRNSPSNRILEALAAAAKRGVSVEVVFEGGGGLGSESQSPDNYAAADWLSQEGVAVYFDSPRKTTHAKLVVVDDCITIVGSANWSYSALSRNNEAGVLIRSKEIAQEYQEYFTAIRKSASRYSAQRAFDRVAPH